MHWELAKGGTLRDAVLRAIPQLRGAYGTVIMDSRDPSTLLTARSGSPMVIGLGMGENFIASDQLALLPVTRRFIFLEEGDIAEVTRRSVTVFDTKASRLSVRRSNQTCNTTRATKVLTVTTCRKRSTNSQTPLKTP